MFRSKYCWALGALAVALTLAVGARSASADTVYTLSVGNSAINSFPGPYATVAVHLVDSTHATFTFTALTQGSDFYRFGGQGAAGVNTNGAATLVGGTLAGISGGSGFSGVDLSDAGSGNEDGFGSFSNTFDEFDGYSWSLTSISFELVKSSGTWADDAHVLAANGSGQFAAAHIFVTASADKSGGALATGFATDGPGVLPGPEPSTMALAFSAFSVLGLGAWRRLSRRRPVG